MANHYLYKSKKVVERGEAETIKEAVKLSDEGLNSFPSRKKEAKLTTMDLLFNTSTGVYSNVSYKSHLKGDEMGFSERNRSPHKNILFQKKINIKQYKLFR